MFRALFLFAKSLRRIAAALEELRDLYRLDLASRGIRPLNTQLYDPVEVAYGESEDRDV